MKPISYICAHRGDLPSFRATPLFKSLEERYPLHVKLHNTEGLSRVYNRFLDRDLASFEYLGPESRRGATDGILIFVHDDVAVIGNNVSQELNRWADEGFAIMGLAGGAHFKVKSPALWHLMTFRGNHSCICVFHNVHVDAITNQRVSMPDLPFPTVTGPLQEVVVLDGLFLAVVREKVDAANWRFDEDFQFHHYDVASCISAHEAGLRMRTVFIPVVHSSPGLIEADDAFRKSEAVFLKKFWGKELRVPAGPS